MLVLPQFDSTTVTSGQFRSLGSIGAEACYLNKVAAVYRPLAKKGVCKAHQIRGNACVKDIMGLNE